MAKVTGPLYSVKASGTVADSFTFGSWKGIAWVRTWFKPANPQSPAQTNNRDALKILVSEWQSASSETKDTYDTFAEGKKQSGFNIFVGRGMKAYISQLGTDTSPSSVTISGDPPDDDYTWS